MKQQTLAVAGGFERYTKKTKRALFLEEMEQVVAAGPDFDLPRITNTRGAPSFAVFAKDGNSEC